VLIKPDGVHLTLAGYELTADEIARVVKSLGH
jgi:lysophospholipase L1-like esterase